jgi:transposase
MFDGNRETRGKHRWIKGQARPGRRRWSAADKARIVAEAMAPAAVVSVVARRWQVHPQQVFAWRREAGCAERAPQSEAIADPSLPAFVPILAVTEAAPADPAAAMASAPALEIELAGAVVRIRAGADMALLTAVLCAIRASATSA